MAYYIVGIDGDYINPTSVQFFKQRRFSGIGCIATRQDTYTDALNAINSRDVWYIRP